MKPPVGSEWKFRKEAHSHYKGTMVVKRHVGESLVECELSDSKSVNGPIRTYPMSYWNYRLVAA